MSEPSFKNIENILREIEEIKKEITAKAAGVEIAAWGSALDAMKNSLQGVNEANWEDQPEDWRLQVLKTLQDLHLSFMVAAGKDGPANPRNIMHRAYASTWWIVILLIYAIVGTCFCLWVVADSLDMMGQDSARTSAIVEPSQTDPQIPNQPAYEGVEEATAISPETESSDEPQTPQDTSQDVFSDQTQFAAEDDTGNQENIHGGQEDQGGAKPQANQRDFMWIIINLGALGGFIHLFASLAVYVGNRELIRSWLPYYFVMPIQAAALAVVVTYTVRAAFFNPLATPNAIGVPGFYAFAALTGMFANQAIEKLKEIFETAFARVRGKDKVAD